MAVPGEQLRAWAKGDYATEAAVEMLIRAHAGRFARTSCPWIEPTEDPDRLYRVDWDKLHHESGVYSGGERRLLNVVVSLGSADHPVDLSNNIAGLDHESLELVLAGIAHAGGSQEWPIMTKRSITPQDGGEPFQVDMPTRQLAESRHPWPNSASLLPPGSQGRADRTPRRPEAERHGVSNIMDHRQGPQR